MQVASKEKEGLFARVQKELLDDRSAWFLLLSNGIIIVLALVQRWHIAELLWTYWLQNIIIGFFNWRRILNLKSFSTKGYKSNGKQVEPTEKTKKSTAWFFLLHYGFFHFAYFIFLVTTIPDLDSRFLLHTSIGLIIFFFNHAFSYRYNKARDRTGNPNIANIMFFPYLRVIPMHLIIFIGGYLGAGAILTLFFFLLLKTAVDMLMHSIGHHLLQSTPKEAAIHIPVN